MFTIGIYDHANWETTHMMQASKRADGNKCMREILKPLCAYSFVKV